MSDPYKVLGVSPTATDDEVKPRIGSWQRNTIPIIMRTVLWRIWQRRK